MSKIQVLEEILGDCEIKDFAKDWIKNSPNCTESTIRQTYNLLKSLGLTNDKIASRAELLGRDPETIDRNYQLLSRLGLTNDKIATQAQLLGMNPETIDRNYQLLSRLGLTNAKIASRAELLGRDPETIDRNYQALSKLGLKDDKIATLAHLLGRDPETIDRNYQKLIHLLRDNYKERTSGRETIQKYAWLLGMSSSTIEAEIQYLSDHELDYRKQPLLLNSKPQSKRKKVAWLLREIYDYKSLNKKEKATAVKSAYELVRSKPWLLVSSIKTLEKKKDRLQIQT